MKWKMILIGLLAATTDYGQIRLQAGDPHIHAGWLQPGHSFYRNIMRDSSTGRILYDFMMENVCTVDSATKRITFSRFRQVPLGSFSADTSVTDLSLRPMSMHEVHQPQNVSFEMIFGKQQATVKTTRKGVVATQSYIMENGYFEDNMIGYIWGCLLLEKGRTYLLDNFNQATAGNDPYTIRYEFDDTLVLGAGARIDCAVLYFTHGAVSGYIWTDKATHQFLKEVGHSQKISFVLTRQ